MTKILQFVLLIVITLFNKTEIFAQTDSKTNQSTNTTINYQVLAPIANTKIISSKKTQKPPPPPPGLSNNVWLNFSKSQFILKQLLINYTQGASNEFESSFDVKTSNADSVDFYSIVSNNNLSVQSRALPFNNQDNVTLGFKTAVSGTYQISVDHFDGLFIKQAVYLYDILLNTVTNLNENTYTFNSNAGTFNHRFELIYSSSHKPNQTFDDNTVIVYNKNEVIYINSGTTTMASVKLYDVGGKLIYENKNINASSTTLDNLEVAKQIGIVRITTENNKVVVKKIAY